MGKVLSRVHDLTEQNMMVTQVGHNHLLIVTFGFRIGFFKFFTSFYQSLLYTVFWGLMGA